MNTCPYVCNNKTEFGYCCSTVCINPMYNQQSITQWLEKADYVQVVRCKDCRWHIDEEPGMVYCRAIIGGWVHNDWFCKSGERKDDDSNL